MNICTTKFLVYYLKHKIVIEIVKVVLGKTLVAKTASYIKDLLCTYVENYSSKVNVMIHIIYNDYVSFLREKNI